MYNSEREGKKWRTAEEVELGASWREEETTSCSGVELVVAAAGFSPIPLPSFASFLVPS